MKGGPIMRTTLTVREAAERLGLHEDTIYNMVKSKQIPHIRARRRILFRAETLDQWMNQKEKESVGAV